MSRVLLSDKPKTSLLTRGNSIFSASSMLCRAYSHTNNFFIIPEEVVMQPRLEVGILVLQSEGLVRRSRYVRFALQFTPTIIIPEPNQIAVLIGYFSRNPDLVAVEVMGLLATFLISERTSWFSRSYR